MIKEKIGNYASLCLKYLQIVARRYVDDGCQHSAAALTYMTLFAVVPMMTVTFSMFSLIPAFQGVGEQVQDLIFKVFIPSAGNEVQSYLGNFTEKARTLSVAGVAILVVTAYLMLRNIERVFNRIWSTTGPRRGVSAFLLYWAVMSLGPILLGSAILMHTYVFSIQLFSEDLSKTALSTLFGYLPLLLTAAAFTLLYTVVPNCKVMLRNALTGGVVAALALELAKYGFGHFMSHSSFTSIYGAFAALPIFLLWVHLCWMIILAGAEFVRTTENFGAEVRGSMASHSMAVYVLWLFWQAHAQGRELSEQRLRRKGISSNDWRTLRAVLLAEKIIGVTESRNYILKRALNDLSLWDVLNFFPSPFVAKGKKQSSPEPAKAADTLGWWSAYNNLLHAYEETNKELLSLSLQDLFQLNQQSTQEPNVAKIN